MKIANLYQKNQQAGGGTSAKKFSPTGKTKVKQTNSGSEGVQSINELANSKDMATLNSFDEFDKLSQLSSNSFICCDAYKSVLLF